MKRIRVCLSVGTGWFGVDGVNDDDDNDDGLVFVSVARELGLQLDVDGRVESESVDEDEEEVVVDGRRGWYLYSNSCSEWISSLCRYSPHVYR